MLLPDIALPEVTFIAPVFLLAGFVQGMVGLGLHLAVRGLA